MASIFRRLLNQTALTRRWISKTQPKNAKEPLDSLDLCTGLQKKEIVSYIEGQCDPFNIAVRKRGPGTKSNPTLIPSAFRGRIVGCICMDNRFINYMWLEKGCPKRCECGHWYQIQEVKPL